MELPDRFYMKAEFIETVNLRFIPSLIVQLFVFVTITIHMLKTLSPTLIMSIANHVGLTL